MKGKTTNVKDLSQFLLLYFIKDGIEINHLKLQKILYYIQSWHLVYFDNNPLFEDKPEAWVNGPVYRKVYNELKQIGIYDNINAEKLKCQDIDNEFETIKSKLNLEPEQFIFLGDIIKHYAYMPSNKLIYMTHIDAPWNEARKDVGAFDYSDNIISHDSMYSFYKNLLSTTKE